MLHFFKIKNHNDGQIQTSSIKQGFQIIYLLVQINNKQ